MTVPHSDYQAFSVAAWNHAARRGLRDKLIINSAKIHTESLLRRNSDVLAQRSGGLVKVLSDWSQNGASITEAMRLPLSLRSLRYSDKDPIWIAALSAAHLHSMGREGEWQASLSSPAPLAFGDRMTEPAREFEVSACNGSIEVRLDGGHALMLDKMETTEIRSVAVGRTKTALLGTASEGVFPLEASEPFCEIPSREVADSLNEAVSILRTWAPDYHAWVEDAITAVAPLRHHNDTHLQSYSVPGLNGIMFASFPTAPLKVAELLVHEMSHQYFHYAQLKTLFANGMDKQKYWSPYVELERPIDRILISFHAFANIVLFYRNCLASGMSTHRENAESEIAFNMTHLGPMSEHLQRSTGLTAAGRSLFEPLRDALFQ